MLQSPKVPRTQMGGRYFMMLCCVWMYPNGDLPLERGVCANVVIRALRSQQVDLQKRVHEEDNTVAFLCLPE